MIHKKKLVVVLGKIEDLSELDIFEALVENFDINVCVTQDQSTIAHWNGSLSLRIFADIPDMPGYLRGLDDELSHADVILTTETSRLASFQAIRGALKHKIPSVVLVNEHRPFLFESYANIKAIQSDILHNANHFIVSSKLAYDRLLLEGVKANRISELKPGLAEHYSVSPKLRQKFRDYIGLNANERLIIFKEVLETHTRPQEALLAFKGLKAINPAIMDKTRLMFVGNGSLEKELKYRAYDFGLAKNVMFMSQNPTPFIKDLYNSSDILLRLKPHNLDSSMQYCRTIIEGMACGVIPMVPKGGIDEILVSDKCFCISDDSYHQIARELNSLLTQDNLLEAMKVKASQIAHNLYDAPKVAPQYFQVLDSVYQGFKGNVDHTLENSIISCIEGMLARHSYHDALVMAEDHLLRNPSPRFHSELLRLKADIHSNAQSFDLATNSYGKSLELDGRNYRAYYGLGQIAFKGHANEDALTFFRKVLAIEPHHAPSLLAIGLLHQRIGLSIESLTWLKRCLAEDNANSKALSAMTQICLDAKDSELGISFLEETREMIGEVPSILIALGKLYLREGRIEESKAILDSALRSSAN